ncbi:MAG: Smr/MutS family protein [Candidatus Lindowbacteria bacterium]|nr:Smr/MutS family protein [Candidatus Lindowbacteria bacterium]
MKDKVLHVLIEVGNDTIPGRLVRTEGSRSIVETKTGILEVDSSKVTRDVSHSNDNHNYDDDTAHSYDKDLETVSSSCEVVDLHGFTIEEAKETLEQVIDQAIINNLFRMRVIHGKGQGTLSGAVRAYLSSHPSVASIEFAPVYLGSFGATMVTLK